MVVVKAKIVSELAGRSLLLPDLVAEALAANGRIKFALSWLQSAQAASAGHLAHMDLEAERSLSGLSGDPLYQPPKSIVSRGDRLLIPGSTRIFARLFEDVASMRAAIDAGSAAAGLNPTQVIQFRKREEAFREASQAHDNLVPLGLIPSLASPGRPGKDSLHALVMDLHKALNAIAGALAEEDVSGARVYRLGEGDREHVMAFMRGLNRTAGLKYDHPGLATTATRDNNRLIIQNDIGTTDAHVLVVHVSDETVTVTYTDVHLQRLLFFESLFERYHVRWEDAVSRRDKSMEDGVYHLSVGQYTGRRREDLEEYLAFLGSRLVFLIDWNRARKRLRSFLPKQAAIDTLKWAADENYGHMAFLKMGGEQLVHEALEFVVKGSHRFGERLDAMLGAHDATQCLRFVLRTCSEGLRQGHSPSLIRDEIKAELLNYFRGAQQNLLDVASAHAALIVEIAGGIREVLLRCRLPAGIELIEHNARRAKEWERKADELVNEARNAARIGDSGAFFRKLVEEADDIADELEDAAFHFTLVPGEGWREDVRQSVLDLAHLLVEGTQEYLKALETARYVQRGGLREDTQDFLESIYRITAIEQRADDAQRGVKRALVCDSLGHRELFVHTESVKRLEGAADGLMHAALMLRDYMLGEVMAR